MDSTNEEFNEFNLSLSDEDLSHILDNITPTNDQLNNDQPLLLNISNSDPDEFDSLNLFFGEDYPKPIDNLLKENDVQLQNPDLNEWDTLFDSFGSGDSNSETALGSLITEFSHILPDALENDAAIVGDNQINDDSNTEIIQPPMQGENNLTYQMCPSLFENIDGTLSVKQQPTANKKPRYESDGKRFLPKSRQHPMSLNLPNLQSISLATNQTFGIVATMVTNTNNERQQSMVHANDFICHDIGTEKLGYACNFIPIKELEKQTNEKKLPHCSIRYKKYSEYSFDLVPFDPLTMFGPAEKFFVNGKPNLAAVPLGKIFRNSYNLLTYKIVFHLALKQDNCIYISNITCETNEINELCESEPSETKPKKSQKRSHSKLEENVVTDDECILDMPTRKHFCSTPSPEMDQLPVTRFSTTELITNYEH